MLFHSQLKQSGNNTGHTVSSVISVLLESFGKLLKYNFKFCFI